MKEEKNKLQSKREPLGPISSTRTNIIESTGVRNGEVQSTYRVSDRSARLRFSQGGSPVIMTNNQSAITHSAGSILGTFMPLKDLNQKIAKFIIARDGSNKQFRDDETLLRLMDGAFFSLVRTTQRWDDLIKGDGASQSVAPSLVLGGMKLSFEADGWSEDSQQELAECVVLALNDAFSKEFQSISRISRKFREELVENLNYHVTGRSDVVTEYVERHATGIATVALILISSISKKQSFSDVVSWVAHDPDSPNALNRVGDVIAGIFDLAHGSSNSVGDEAAGFLGSSEFSAMIKIVRKAYNYISSSKHVEKSAGAVFHSLMDRVAERERFVHLAEDFVSNISNRAGVMYENIEKLCKSFVDVCSLISDARSVEDANALLSSFESSPDFEESGVKLLVSLAKYGGNNQSNSDEMFTTSLILKKRLDNLVGRTLPKSIGELSATSQVQEGSEAFSYFNKLVFNYVPSLTIDSDGVVLLADGYNEFDLVSAAVTGGPGDRLSPAVLFQLGLLRLMSDDAILKEISSAARGGEVIGHIQFPVFIKDVLLTKIRSISVAIEMILNLKALAYRRWLSHYETVIVNLVRSIDFKVQYDSTLLLDVMTSTNWARQRKMLDQIDSSTYGVNGGQPMSDRILPLFSFERKDGHQMSSFGRILSDIATSKKGTTILARSVSKCKQLFVTQEGKRAFDPFEHSTILAARFLKSYEAFEARLSGQLEYSSQLSYDDSVVDALLVDHASLIQNNLALCGGGLWSDVSLKLHLSALGSNNDMFSAGVGDSVGDIAITNREADSSLVSFANTAWKSAFSAISGIGKNSELNQTRFLAQAGPYALQIIRVALDPFEGLAVGMPPLERISIGIKFGVRSAEEKLDLLLQELGLHRGFVIGKREAAFLTSYVASASRSSNFPFAARDVDSNSLTKDITLADVLTLNPLFDERITNSGSTSGAVEFPQILLRSDEYVNLLFSDCTLLELPPKVVLIADGDSLDSLYFGVSSDYYLEISARMNLGNVRLALINDVRILGRRVVYELLDAIKSLSGRGSNPAIILKNGEEDGQSKFDGKKKVQDLIGKLQGVVKKGGKSGETNDTTDPQSLSADNSQIDG